MTDHPGRELLALHAETVRVVLPNGLTVLVRRDPSAHVVAIVTHVKAGYFDETDDEIGIAHVLEHMYFKGTPTRGVGAIARDTKSHGGYLNAHTIYDHTTYYTVLPSDAFVAGLEIQFDAYAHSVIDAGELGRDLEVIIQEAKRKRDTPSAVTIETLYAVLHDRHRIRRWRIGEEAGLRTFTQADLLRFYRTWYQPSNTILSVVGDIEPATVVREIAARYGTLADTPVPRARGPVELAPPGVRVRDWRGDVAHHHLAFGWRAPSLDSADAPALEVGGLILGTGRASRLYRAVREAQLASSVSAWHYTSADVGVFTVHAEGPAETAPAAAVRIWRELESVRRDGVRATEVHRAQRILEARWLRRLETMDGQAMYLASWEAEGGLPMAAHYFDQLQAITPAVVQEAMGRCLDPAQLSLVSYHPDTTSPLADSAEALEALLATARLDAPRPPMSEAGTPGAQAAPIAAPAVHTTPASEVVAGVHVLRLPSGIPVLVCPRPGAPLVSLGIVQRGGSGLEPAGADGLARLTAQTMLKGTTSRSAAAIAEATEELGGSIGVSAGLESLGWSLSVPVRHLPTATALLADVLQHPTFPDDAVETERTQALAELRQQRDDMYRWPMRLATSAAYGAHPYGRAVGGTEASLATLTADRLRAFHADRIRSAASVLAIVGDVTPASAYALLADGFSGLSFQEESGPPPVAWPAQGVTVEEQREKQQTAMALLFPGPGRSDPARHAAQLLSAIASGLGGRLFEQLRDRQSLAYTVSAFPVDRRAGGLFAAYIATAPAREAEARAGLFAEFAKFAEAPPTEEELTRAQRYLVGTHAISQQSAGAVLGEIVDAWLFGDGLAERTAWDSAIRAVTAADVQHLAQRYFDPARVITGLVRGIAR